MLCCKYFFLFLSFDFTTDVLDSAAESMLSHSEVPDFLYSEKLSGNPHRKLWQICISRGCMESPQGFYRYGGKAVKQKLSFFRLR